VGVAHMSWIDTPLVRDAKDDLSTFRKMIASAPYPINQTTSVEACAKAFVAGIEGRKRIVFVPGWVGVAKRLRNLINSPIGERDTLKHTRRLLPEMDEEVRRLGRSTSARNVTLDD
jgi:hypothetical protein